MKGTVQGVTGLVAKPITGILDAASKTSEGIKNTAQFFDEKPSDNKLRYPRAFYGRDKYYKYYIDTDAEILYYLHTYKDVSYPDFLLVAAYDIFPHEKDKELVNIFALALDQAIYWSLKKKDTLWEIRFDNINNMIETKDGIEIYPIKNSTKTPV